MTSYELVVLAFALAMDAVAVSLAEGLRLRRPRWRDALLVAAMFGIFQALMPVVGWLLAFRFADGVSDATPWIAFGLLVLIGAHMIKESFDDDDHGVPSVVTVRSVTPLAIATSIDAAAVGVTFGVLEVDVAPAVAVIGLVTAVLSLAAVFLGARVGERLGRWASLVGGAILGLIGLRILLAHLLG